jgi:ribose transport system permease protein
MNNKKFLAVIFEYSQFLMLVLICLFLAITTPAFRTLENLTNILMQQMPFLLIISIGMTMAILTKGIDLSIGSTIALSSCVGAFFIKDGNIVTGIVAALAIGILIGLTNGLLITKVQLVPFIATYTMNMVVRGLTFLFMGGLLYYGFDKGFRRIATGSIGPFSNLFIFAIVIFLIMFFILKKTTFGASIYSMGMNRNATQLSGIHTDRKLIAVYTLNGFLAAVTGILYIARLNAAESTIGTDFTIKMIAATLIGGTPFSGGKGGIERTLLGVAIMMVISNGLNINGVSSLWQEVVFGVVIIISLFIDKLGEKFISRA